jgi:ribose 5-phosphate isomerase
VQAVEYVQSGMVLGLGTGSTAAFAVAKIGELLKVFQAMLCNLLGVHFANPFAPAQSMLHTNLQ